MLYTLCLLYKMGGIDGEAAAGGGANFNTPQRDKTPLRSIYPRMQVITVVAEGC